MTGAAAAFHLLASTALRRRGELDVDGDPRRQVAKILIANGDGALQPHRYIEYVDGVHDPASERLATWCAAWVAAGYEPIAITVDHEGWRPVTPGSSPATPRRS